jgi:RNA polymerase sigma-70 factor (ECF subfamily)
MKNFEHAAFERRVALEDVAVRVVNIERARPARPDAELLRRIAHADLTALGELFDRYHRDVRRAVARTLPNSNDVDDIVQATFLEVPRAAASFEGEGSCRPWLAGIAVRLSLRHRRGLGRWLRTLTSFGHTGPSASQLTPESETSDKQELAVFQRALARVSDKKRAAFVLVELEGLSAEEAGDALGVPAATIRTRLFHVRGELRDAMKRGGAW